jgi:hypothetical protein
MDVRICCHGLNARVCGVFVQQTLCRRENFRAQTGFTKDNPADAVYSMYCARQHGLLTQQLLHAVNAGRRKEEELTYSTMLMMLQAMEVLASPCRS